MLLLNNDLQAINKINSLRQTDTDMIPLILSGEPPMLKSENDLEHEIMALINSTPLSEKICISAWGIEKAGKSSLLNELTGHVECEFFPTNVIRETIKNKAFETEHYIFLDTPGIDSEDAVEKEAYKGLDSADIILFVHYPQGELHQQEVDLLKYFHSAFGDNVKDRLIVVLTSLDTSENNSLNKIQDAVLEQCNNLLGFKPVCFQVSNTRHRHGCLKNNQVLIEKSGIPALKSYINEVRPAIYKSMAIVRDGKKKIQVENLLEKIKKKMFFINTQVGEMQKPYVEAFKLANNATMEMKKFHSDSIMEMEKFHPDPVRAMIDAALWEVGAWIVCYGSASSDSDAVERKRIQLEAEKALRKKKKLEKIAQLEKAYPEAMNSYLSTIVRRLQPFWVDLEAPTFTVENSYLLRNEMNERGSGKLEGRTSETTDESATFEKVVSALLYANFSEKPFYKETIENIKLIDRLFQRPSQPNNQIIVDLRSMHELLRELAGLHVLRVQLATQFGWLK